VFHGGGLNQRLDTQNAQERAAYEPEEHIVAEEKVRYEREAEGSHEPVNCVSVRRAQRTPMGPTGAAMTKPMMSPLRKKVVSMSKRLQLFYPAGITLTMEFSTFHQKLYNFTTRSTLRYNAPKRP
jgi:hypothetical protein